MTSRTVNISPQVYARIAGVLYLLNIACGLFGEIYVRSHLVVAGDALTTAHRIMGSEFLFRCGIAGDLIMHITDVPMTVIFLCIAAARQQRPFFARCIVRHAADCNFVRQQTESCYGAASSGRLELSKSV
jgi:hypothetical protein